jgi:pimeloyl-ACP methyl ester carboxylesterase
MAKPTIVFVPGFWEGPAVFASLATTLESPLQDYPTLGITLPSTGKISPDNENLQADVRSIRKQIEPLVEAGKDIILVMHSAGGFLGSNAIEGWSLDARKKAGKQGGIKKLVFLAAGISPEGTMHADAPFFEKDVSVSVLPDCPSFPHYCYIQWPLCPPIPTSQIPVSNLH